LIYYIQSRTDGIVNSREGNPTGTFTGKRHVMYLLFIQADALARCCNKGVVLCGNDAKYGCYDIVSWFSQFVFTLRVGWDNWFLLLLFRGSDWSCFLPVRHDTYRPNSKVDATSSCRTMVSTFSMIRHSLADQCHCETCILTQMSR
jgi:hypothetical protein